MTSRFVSKVPTLEECWRGIVLYGRNVASYKFALAKALIELKPTAGTLIKIHELAPAFAKQITEHLKLSDKQGTSKSSVFLNACRDFNSGKLTEEELVKQTVRTGFNNVIDAFHVVGRGDVASRFYTDERKENDGIRITDEFNELLENRQLSNLEYEVEGRWRLVERAWDLNVSRNLIAVDYDAEQEVLFTVDSKQRRKSVTGCRDALNGYQKGKCFYCFADIDIDSQSALCADVDHFLPHTIIYRGWKGNINGVWNLVLACRECNRGTQGKFDNLPDAKLLNRIHARNEYLIFSHHPLRETLIRQTGNTPEIRWKNLTIMYNDAVAVLPQKYPWRPIERAENCFSTY